eukprot:CAMPEP_0183375288 /NCGR_PEP_ID=MMETSP0164_2-20130417/116894_1 /TAXON_ID=221442 /ORGANISM="Coccolithus pelagicus ssp braarudi, Strain PLY182g" /LENGTH=134 /DNA_ID=CAMNT_0025552435 /DNA_START=147 /DNA_END=551 /DNA_ORIENTATION=-
MQVFGGMEPNPHRLADAAISHEDMSNMQRWPLLGTTPYSYRKLVATLVNGMILASCIVVLSDLLFISAKWTAKVSTAFAMSLVESLLIGDAIKTVILTLFSPAMLPRDGPTKWVSTKKTRRLLRFIASWIEKFS